MSLYLDNYNNVLPVKTDPADLVRRWFFSIRIRDERGNPHIVYPAIFSSFTYQKGERIQVVNGFNEVNHIYAFGKNPGQIRLSGHVLSVALLNDSFRNTNWALTDHYNQVHRAFAAAELGLRTEIYGPNVESNGRLIMKGIANEFVINMNANINSVLNFSVNFIEVDSMMSVGAESTVSAPITRVGSLNILSLPENESLLEDFTFPFENEEIIQ